MDETKTEMLARLLEAVAAGELDAKEAMRQWPNADTESDELLSASWHDLLHYAEDSDIRTRDPKYAAYQCELLLQRAQQIRSSSSGGRPAQHS